MKVSSHVTGTIMEKTYPVNLTADVIKPKPLRKAFQRAKVRYPRFGHHFTMGQLISMTLGEIQNKFKINEARAKIIKRAAVDFFRAISNLTPVNYENCGAVNQLAMAQLKKPDKKIMNITQALRSHE
ncbi:MAG: hypothetical protein GY710_01995 [Desulfobacteraceae bacterium]|nr:hypothetical protein [Desulfobacteraceae bacterium]